MRTINIPEGASDFERLRLIYKSLVDECKQHEQLTEAWVQQKAHFLRRLDEQDAIILDLRKKLEAANKGLFS